MEVIRVRNVHQALPVALARLRVAGVREPSRNGEVLRFPEPVTTVYRNPTERVVFWAARDANPFFHLMESLWMLAGRNDVEFVARYVSRMRDFSDDGVTFHGAYGYRWRVHFERDQLTAIIDALRKNPKCRRQVLSMWDARVDLGGQGKDFPCNLQAVFQIAPDGRLDMMVTNRSNDLIWGAYGANAVHFSYLHEYVAAGIGIPVGVYRQVSANLHAYESVLPQVIDLADFPLADPLLPASSRAMLCPYEAGRVQPFPAVQKDRAAFDDDLEMFFTNPNSIGYREPFFRKIVVPMWSAFEVYREEKRQAQKVGTMATLSAMPEKNDWRLAAIEWVARREAAFLKRRAKAQDDGVDYGE